MPYKDPVAEPGQLWPFYDKGMLRAVQGAAG